MAEASRACLLTFFVGMFLIEVHGRDSLRPVVGEANCVAWISLGVNLGALCNSRVPKSPECGAPHHLRCLLAFLFFVGLRRTPWAELVWTPAAACGLPDFWKRLSSV